jgi:hypothetical protein
VRDDDRKKKMELQGCSANNWYQSEKILAVRGDGGEIPLKPTTTAAYSIRGGGRWREARHVGGVMP